MSAFCVTFGFFRHLDRHRRSVARVNLRQTRGLSAQGRSGALVAVRVVLMVESAGGGDDVYGSAVVFIGHAFRQSDSLLLLLTSIRLTSIDTALRSASCALGCAGKNASGMSDLLETVRDHILAQRGMEHVVRQRR